MSKKIEIDGKGFDAYSPYRSKCAKCLHFNFSELNCKAFPNGIPEIFLSGKEVHSKVEKNQVGNIIFIEG
jgi:hypothetical protein